MQEPPEHKAGGAGRETSPPPSATRKVSPLLQVQKHLRREKLNREKAWTERFPSFPSSFLRQMKIPMVAMKLSFWSPLGTPDKSWRHQRCLETPLKS